ncbi:MAG TPA: TonB family protein [Vicinamibacterales bacterium]|nr:TonB family protein [Vicinamibacterales bacterium]
MYIDFEDRRPETPRVERALSAREGVLVSIIVHLLLVIGLLFLPDPPKPDPEQRSAVRINPPPQESPRFVFMQPRVDIRKPQPRVDVDASDQDRVRSTIQRPPDPQNALPFARGNSRAREEAELAPQNRGSAEESAVARGRPTADTEGQMTANDPSRSMIRLPQAPSAAPPLAIGESGSRGRLGDALRNLSRYVQQESFDNAQGGGDGQGLIQFDSKGADFGPWLRRFVAQVKRNWFIPQAAMIMKGHVVITFNIHRDGTITDIEVKKPSHIESFNHAAVNALMTSSPTQPLPAEYPSESAFFTVTFLYNEDPADIR